MAITLKVRPGLSAPLVNAIPKDWDAQWFRRWITDFLNVVQIAAGVTQIIAGTGIAVSPAGGVGAVTISVGSSGVITSVVGTANEIAVSTTGTVATLSFPQNVVIPLPGSGYALQVNSLNGNSINIAAPTGSPNSFNTGATYGGGNGIDSGLVLQSSGRQTELWHYAGTSGWQQVVRWTTAYAAVFNGTNAVVTGVQPVVTIVNNSGTFNSTSAYASLVLYNTSSTAQTSIDFVLNGTLYGRLRSDYGGNVNYVSTLSGVHVFFTGGDTGVGGTEQFRVSSGSVSVAATLFMTSGTIARQSIYGFLNGQYPSVETGSTAGCIYAIGGSWFPNAGSTNALGALYGCGYTTSSTTSGSGSTISAVTGVALGKWGFYVASGGAPRIFLDADDGIVYTTNGVYTGGWISAGATISVTNGDISANRGNGTGAIFLGNGPTYLYFNGSFYAFGNGNQVQAGSFFATSDRRLKGGAVRIKDALAKVNRLRGVTFTWNKKAAAGQRGQRSAGLIAQDVECVLPEAVSESGVGANGEATYKTLNYAATNGLLVEAIRELLVRIERLEAA